MAKYQADPLNADGRSDAFRIYNGPRKNGASITKRASVQATDFGGGTATLQISDDDSATWIDVLDASGSVVTFAANKSVLVDLPSDAENPSLISINLAGSTNPSNVVFTIFDAR